MTPYRPAPPMPSRPPRTPRWRVWLAFACGLGGRMRRRAARLDKTALIRAWRRHEAKRADPHNRLTCADRACPSCNLEPR